jgi:hypothetical protein
MVPAPTTAALKTNMLGISSAGLGAGEPSEGRAKAHLPGF